MTQILHSLRLLELIKGEPETLAKCRDGVILVMMEAC